MVQKKSRKETKQNPINKHNQQNPINKHNNNTMNSTNTRACAKVLAPKTAAPLPPSGFVPSPPMPEESNRDIAKRHIRYRAQTAARRGETHKRTMDLLRQMAIQEKLRNVKRKGGEMSKMKSKRPTPLRIPSLAPPRPAGAASSSAGPAPRSFSLSFTAVDDSEDEECGMALAALQRAATKNNDKVLFEVARVTNAHSGWSAGLGVQPVNHMEGVDAPGNYVQAATSMCPPGAIRKAIICVGAHQHRCNGLINNELHQALIVIASLTKAYRQLSLDFDGVAAENKENATLLQENTDELRLYKQLYNERVNQ
jgi:hypothetical protein